MKFISVLTAILFLPCAATASIRDHLPNSLALDLSENRTRVELEGRETLVGKKQSIGSAGEFSRLVDSFTFTSLEKTTHKKFEFKFRWVPTFSFAFQNIHFDSSAAFLSETDFQIFRTSLGFGPEMILDSKVGTFYLNTAPGAAYSWVSWSSPAAGGSMARSNLNWTFSSGYYRYVLDSIAMRFFIRAIMEDSHVWNEAMDSSQGFNIPVKRVFNTIVGLSFIYSY